MAVKCKYCGNELEKLEISDEDSDIFIVFYVCNVCDVVYFENGEKLEEI